MSATERKLLDPVIADLTGLRRRARLILLARRVAIVLAALIASALALGLLDYALRLPRTLRVLHWAFGVACVLFVLWRYVLPAARFCPRLTDLALRIEAFEPRLRGLLASAVDFATGGDKSAAESSPVSRGLIDIVLRQARESFPTRVGGAILDRGVAVQAASMLALAIAAGAVLFGFSSQSLFATGATRLLTPWSDASWPKRTGVASDTEIDIHPRGAALPLRAAVTKHNRAFDDMDVFVSYRLIDEDAGPWKRELLTWQGADVDAERVKARGAVFERLVETNGNVLEYRFETEDDRTETQRVTLVDPPAVLRAEATITPPSYASDDASGESLTSATTVDLGPGTDERALAPAALAGARVAMTVSLNKPVDLPADVRAAVTGVDPDASIEADGASWTFAFDLSDSLRMPIFLTDGYDIESVEEAVYRFEAVADRPAAATMTDPVTDRNVLPTALAELGAEGRDDVGLEWVGVERSIARPVDAAPGSDPSGPGGAMAPAGEPEMIARTEANRAERLHIDHALDLSVLGLRPGDEVYVAALALDIYRDAAGEPRAPSRSVVRTLRIISEEQFIEEIQRQFNDVRESAKRIESQQGEVQERAQTGRASREARRGQAQVSERLERQQGAIDEIRERIEQNGLNDPTVDDLLRSAQAALERAGEASAEASRSMDEAAARNRENPDPEAENPDDAPMTDEEAREVDSSQEDVRRELLNLAELLDRGEDNFVVRRKLESLTQQQQELREQTAQAAANTTGRSPEELNQRERSEMERIVERQRDLAEQLQSLIDEMREREEALREADPASAEGMSQAASRAERQQTSQTMEEAAEQAEGNQMTRAGEQQDEALEDLQEMMEDIEAANRQREEILQRVLSSVIQAIEGLITTQEAEIDLLAEAKNRGDYTGRDEAMIALSRNTLGVVDQIAGSGAELAPVGAIVDRAYDAQVRAVTALRREQIDHEATLTHEQGSLEMLERALEEAKELQQQMNEREQQRKLQELRQSYRDVLEQQVSLREETTPFAELDELSRRDRVLVRKLSDRQDGLRDVMREIREETEELAEARVFDFAHTRVDQSMERATVKLAEADPAAALVHERDAIRVIAGMLQALEDLESESDFDEGAGGGGAGGGGGGSGGEEPLIPPLKELVLLRELQKSIAEATTEVNTMGDAADPALIEDVAEGQRRLFEVGEELIRRLNDPTGGGGMPEIPSPPAPPGPDDAGDEPEDDTP